MNSPALPDASRSLSAGNTAVVPSTRPDYSPEQLATWMQRHDAYVAQARRGGFDVVFFGNSLTDGWHNLGKGAWDRFIAPLNAANYGLGGDRTQQVLWRMLNGEIDGLDPKAVVLLIGTNNTDPGLGENSLTPRNTASEIVAGVGAIVETVKARLPRARILLHGIFPRGLADAPVRQQIAEINASLRKLDDGGWTVTFVDIGAQFLEVDGSLTAAFQPDRLHLSEAGYERWADALQAPLAKLLSG